MDKFIPLSIPNFEGNERKYVDDAIDQGWVSTGGAYINRLEKEIAEFLNTHDVAACQSGTAALHLSLRECGVVPGDVVLVSPLTFIAAVNPIAYQFAEPVFIDCDDSLCIDPVKIKEFCENECIFDGKVLKYNNKQVKAIVVVHVFGDIADMENIMNIALKYNLKVIEDATEALGSRFTEGKYAGKFAGTIGDYGAFSFNGNKIITTGGGGAVTANCKEAVDRLRYLSTQAKDDPQFYIHNEIGYNYRMTNLQAALGVAQIECLPEFIRRKNSNFELYKKMFEGFELAVLKDFKSNVYSNKWFYSLVIDTDKVTTPIRTIIAILENKGIQTRAIWGLINEQLPYRKYTTYKLDKAVYYAQRVLNIPCSTSITPEEITYTANTIMTVLKELSCE